MDKQKFGFSIGIFDILSQTIREKIKSESGNYEVYALGVYTDEFVKNELLTDCMKNTEQRMEIAESLEGVDFTFPIDTKESNIAKKEIEKAYMQYLENQQHKLEKKYKVGFVIGSFDLLHSGHIENIKLAKEQCEKLAVVVKTDERILQNKHKKTAQNTQERASILNELKSVDKVFYMDLHTTREEIIDQISEYYDVEKKDMVAIFGSDLKDKEEQHKEELKEINVIYTNRNKEKMKTVSSTYYQKKCKNIEGGLQHLENLEEEHFQ